MPYIPPEVVARAREVDLLTYLRTYEPQELGEGLLRACGSVWLCLLCQIL